MQPDPNKGLFKRADLQELVWEDSVEVDGYELKLIENEICSQTRWSVVYEFVARWKDKYFSGSYSKGATEYQDESPFEYDGDVIQLQRVVPVEVIKIEYKPV